MVHTQSAMLSSSSVRTAVRVPFVNAAHKVITSANQLRCLHFCTPVKSKCLIAGMRPHAAHAMHGVLSMLYAYTNRIAAVSATSNARVLSWVPRMPRLPALLGAMS
jgi:hypothetical protein